MGNLGPQPGTKALLTVSATPWKVKDQVAKQSVEIENLKNVCDVQNSCNKKLEQELAQAKASK